MFFATENTILDGLNYGEQAGVKSVWTCKTSNLSRLMEYDVVHEKDVAAWEVQ
ncbi:MAG: hypothetical protein ABEI52_09605 [Halobacteriaceae archaeon]